MLIWILVILLLILTFRWWAVLVAAIAAILGPLIGCFLVVGLFLLAVVLLLVAASPVFHWIAVAMGPQMFDRFVIPILGMGAIFGPFIGLYDSMTGWKMTKAVYQTTRNLFAFRHGNN